MPHEMPSIKGEMDKLQAEEAQQKQEQLYEKAKQKAESFIHEIDPDLSVEVKNVDVVLEESKEHYTARVLEFNNKRYPDLAWTQEIEENEDYINKVLEPATRRTYLRHMKMHSLLPESPDQQPVFMEEVIGEHSPDMEKLRELAKQYPELGVALADTIDKIINPITSDEDATKEIDAFNRSHMKEKEGMYETVHLASSNREITVKYYRNGSVSISASFLS